MSERAWFILVSVIAGVALILVLLSLLIDLLRSRISEIEQANQIGTAGEHLAALEAARTRRGFRNTTRETIDRAIESIRCAINRRTGVPARGQRRVRVHVTRPPGVEVDVQIDPVPAGQEPPPAEGDGQ